MPMPRLMASVNKHLFSPPSIDKDEPIPLLPAGTKHPSAFLWVSKYLQTTRA